jgi:hypothetical protein
MMNVSFRICFFACISVAAMQPLVFAQSPEPAQVIGCKEIHRDLTPSNPRLGTDGNIIVGQAIVQMRLALGENTTVKVVEYPRSLKVLHGHILDSYSSTIIVQRGQERKEYSVGRLIKLGLTLRLVEVASLCTSSSGQGTVFLAFESSSIGLAQGFAVIRYSAETVDVQALPMANQGRIVVSKAEPEKVEMWSATGSAGPIDCDACKKYYAVKDCDISQQSVVCKQRLGTRKIVAPDTFMNARIEVR